MGRLRTVPLDVKIQRFLLTRKVFLIFVCSTFIPIFICAFLLYHNLDHVVNFSSHLNPLALFPSLKIFQSKNSAGYGSTRKRGMTVHDRTIRYRDYNYLVAESLTYENRTYEKDLEVLFRFPKKRDTAGLLLICHGCGRSAYEWFHTIERQRIIGAAIDMGYACLVFQASDQSTRCWSTDTDLQNNVDVQRVFKALDYFYKEYPNLVSLPRFAFGASSGGMFSSIFVINQRWKIQGQILFISIVVPDILENAVKVNNYPSTAWIYMLRDTEFASESRIKASMRIFTRENISHIAFNIEPISLGSRTFHERIPTITSDTSNYILYRLRQNHWLDSDNYLIYNPRRDKEWRTFLFETNEKTTVASAVLENLRNHENVIAEFLNTVYGQHEISFERSFEALTWLKRHSSRPSV